MKKENFWWLLWGVGIAFGLQVLYDGLGKFPDLTQKFWYGLIMEAIYLLALFLYGLFILKKFDPS